ncbi:fatty acid desaturase family protein [Pedobacter punctiformis]|uniref:Fatty acid desaturase n=1 Tax=Pedobacter punctiformis TaxID=3004097 RepID=A0ABT4LC65_9SPHI|nr:fatty acid desaturase [Pedobacter sp. HCMS5-2]MCZ4245483.1 fatty acid desaturase [Pedobacter sp. HCMS5-2]
MKDKHIHVPADSQLLKEIYRRVASGIVIEKPAFTRMITLKFVFYFSLSIFAYTGLFQINNPMLFVLCFIAYGLISLLFAFNFSHDFSHNTIFKRKKLNHIAFVIIYTIVGAHAEAWKLRHINSHHYAPNVEDYDSDLKISKLIRVIPDSKCYWFHRYQHFYAPLAYTTYSLFWIFIKDFVILFSKDEYRQKKGFKYHLSFWVQKIAYVSLVVILPLLLAQQTWTIVLTGFLMMHLIQSLFLLFTFFMTHHVEQTEYPKTDNEGYIKTSWLMNQIKSSNDMHPFSKLANFILGGFNNHIAHHLFPHYHHIFYPQISKILYKVLLENNIKPNVTTYFGGVVSHLKLLKKMGESSKNSTKI